MRAQDNFHKIQIYSIINIKLLSTLKSLILSAGPTGVAIGHVGTQGVCQGRQVGGKVAIETFANLTNCLYLHSKQNH